MILASATFIVCESSGVHFSKVSANIFGVLTSASDINSAAGLCSDIKVSQNNGNSGCADRRSSCFKFAKSPVFSCGVR